MQLRNILAATDNSEAGSRAVRAAVDLGGRASARVTALHVITAKAVAHRLEVTGGLRSLEAEDEGPPLERLRSWLETEVLSPGEAALVQLGIAYGLPGIEICRFAEESHADLIVVGRKHHCERARLLLEDTVDAVARRSRLPALFVPPVGGTRFRGVLVALDGSDQGMTVLENACGFARSVGASLQVVTVEGRSADELLHRESYLPAARTSILQARVRELVAREGFPDVPVAIREGIVVEAVVATVRETNADVLAIGYHRGGPSGMVEPSSTAQSLGHAAPCAVLTIPL